MAGRHGGRRRAPGVPTFVAMMLAVAWWCFTDAIHEASPTLDARFAWSQATCLAIALAPTLWLALPIIVLTGNEGEGTILDDGADALLTKPTDLRRLVAEVELLLGTRGPPG